jgi:hypothetical protein
MGKPQNVVAFFLGGPNDGRVEMATLDAKRGRHECFEINANAIAFVWEDLPPTSRITLFETLRLKFERKPSSRSDIPEGL